MKERERESEQEWGRGRRRERHTQNPKQAPGTEPNVGLELPNRETVT